MAQNTHCGDYIDRQKLDRKLVIWQDELHPSITTLPLGMRQLYYIVEHPLNRNPDYDPEEIINSLNYVFFSQTHIMKCLQDID